MCLSGAVHERLCSPVSLNCVLRQNMLSTASVRPSPSCARVCSYRSATDRGWRSGNFQGLLFTSSDHVTSHTHIISHKYERQRSHTSSSNDQDVTSGGGGASEKQHTFLNVTFTRALKRNVKKRLKLADGDSHSLGFGLEQGLYAHHDVILLHVYMLR